MQAPFKGSSSNGSGRVIHQDYIARVRYSNALPPPSIPPKFLDIPNTGLASGQYTTPGFASRLAREQPLNIEIDAELGMPLDLVGMPGIFDGDESSIQAPSQAPTIHPHDRPLLRPLSTLGRPKINETTVSFLRRTEYISSVSKRVGGALRDPHDRIRRAEKRPAAEPDDSPAAIKRKIDKSFEQAQDYLKDLTKIKHPDRRPGVKIVDAFPILPDLDAFPDSGAYVTMKFLTNPIQSKTSYDTRLLNGLFKPCENSAAEEAAYAQALEAWERDPENYSKPAPILNYDFYLNNSASDAARFRAKFDIDNPENDEDELYPNQGESGPCFQFTRLRAYETVRETELNHQTKYDSEILLAYDDGDIEGQKALWYYPVMQRSTIRPQRQKRIDFTRGMGPDEEVQVVDQLDVTVHDPTDEMRTHMLKYKEHPYGFDDEEAQAEGGEAEHDAEESLQREGANGASRSSPRSDGEDQDADADEDD